MIEAIQRYLARRRTAYIKTFLSSAFGDEVLRDLAKFCRAHDSTFHENPDVAKHLEGRRQVWLRIQEHLHLTDEQLYALYGGAPKGE